MAHSLNTAVTCSQIEGWELETTIDLLRAGFPERSRHYWSEAMARLGAHRPPAGFPGFGFALRADGRQVGVLLLIASRATANGAAVRVNVSSWYVEPEFRAYAPLLVLRAISRKQATYINVSPSIVSRAIIEAQGFRKSREGLFAGVPLLARSQARARLLASPKEWEAARTMDEESLRLLMDHHRFGCISLWCETDRGAEPIILRARTLRSERVRCAQLLYARSREALDSVAGGLGRFLARRGVFLMLASDGGAQRGMVGRYFPHRLPIYTKGPEPLAPFDLAYTEVALFGF